MKNKTWIQTIWNAVCAPFVVMGMAFGIYGFVIPESGVSKVVRDKVVDFFYTLDITFAILRVAIFALLGYAMHQLVFSSDEAAPVKKQLDVSESSPVTNQYLVELVVLLTIAVVLLWGVWNLIAEALDGGMIGGGIEFSLGVIELAGIPMLLFFLVIPEMVRVLKGLGYIRTKSETMGINSIIFQIIRNSMLSILIGFGLILGVVLTAMEIWEKSRTVAGSFVFGAFTLFLLAFRPTFMGMVGKFSDMRSQLAKGKESFLIKTKSGS